MKNAALSLIVALVACFLQACSTSKPTSAPPGYEADTTPGDNGENYR